MRHVATCCTQMYSHQLLYACPSVGATKKLKVVFATATSNQLIVCIACSRHSDPMVSCAGSIQDDCMHRNFTIPYGTSAADSEALQRGFRRIGAQKCRSSCYAVHRLYRAHRKRNGAVRLKVAKAGEIVFGVHQGSLVLRCLGPLHT